MDCDMLGSQVLGPIHTDRVDQKEVMMKAERGVSLADENRLAIRSVMLLERLPFTLWLEATSAIS